MEQIGLENEGGIETAVDFGITKEKLQEWTGTLEKYKAGKSNLEKRVIEAEQFWKLRHWQQIRKHEPGEIEPSSGWLTNSILAKHSDATDAYPEAVLLAREPGDEEEAKMLTSIVPCVLENAGFREAWDDTWWDKLKGGTGIYAVVWDKFKMGGIGDIAVRCVDILNIFWTPGISHIQDSKMVFYVHLEYEDYLKEQYPQLVGKQITEKSIVSQYIYDDSISTEGMAPVIDCYYKKNGLLHYCQYVGDTVLYATEDDPERSERGLYDHGLYPFEFDALWPEKGYPNCGFGYVDLDRDAQITVDILNSAFTKNVLHGSVPRFFSRQDGNVNPSDILDLTKAIIPVNGNVDEATIRQIQTGSLPPYALDFLQLKVDEMKEVGGNRDVNNGGAGSGVTAASAIAALQEAGNGLSRDMIEGSYRAFRGVVNMVIELIRQYYDVPRYFRILGQFNQPKHISYSNAGLKPQSQGGMEFGVDMGMRLPVFDIEVEVQTESSYTKEGYNQLAIQLFQMGIFNPQLADQAMMMLDMMDFKGKDDIQQKISQNQQLFMQAQQYQQMAVALAAKYEPGMAEGLAMGMDMGAQIPQNSVKIQNTGEHAAVRKARENAQQGAMPR